MSARRIFTSISLILALFCASSFAKYSGGTGEPNDPYLIATPNDLNSIGLYPADWDKHFLVTADINIADINGSQFNIIGNNLKPFSGMFDGNGHSVFSLTIDTGGVGKDYLGLFGMLAQGSVINNLLIADVNIVVGENSHYIGGLCGSNAGAINNSAAVGLVTGSHGSDYIGGLCGSNTGIINNSYAAAFVAGGSGSASDYVGGLCGLNTGSIYNCHASGSVISGRNADYIGGFCGNNSSKISNCYVAVSVTGGENSDCLGGFCGINKGIINNCYSTGPIVGDEYSERIGGLCGRNEGKISNCHASGNVGGDYNSGEIGGLCGRNNGTIGNCYSNGSVAGDSDVGGFCGINNQGNILNCYFLDTAGPDNGLGTPLTDGEMKQQISFVNWDFFGESANGTSSFWIIEPNNYPELFFFNDSFIPYEFEGAGTETEPYLIYDSNDLVAIWQKPQYHYNLVNDINLAGIQWSVAIIPCFNGNFNGDGYIISNLVISGGSHLGLFDQLSNNTSILNLGIKDVNITSYSYSPYRGGICGINYGTIRNCYVSGSINSGDSTNSIDYLGGLCGSNFGIISDCYSNCSVICGYGAKRMGGLCGYNESDINNCYATGFVIGGSSSGSLGGLCGFSRGTISNCYASGSVSGGDDSGYMGGLCGADSFGIISNCYATGSVTGGNDVLKLGGLCGEIRGTTTNCYASGSVTSGENSSYLGSLCGNNDGTISDCYFLDTAGPNNGYGILLTDTQMKQKISFSDWDFIDIWDIGENQTYPFLRVHLPSDINKDDETNLYDFAIIALNWLSEE